MTNSFIQLIRNPVKFRMFLFSRLPAALFSGVRLKHVDEEKCEVTVPYKWFTRNPFGSTYFASLSMAAEMSTGILAMANVYGRKPSVSMLVLKVSGDFKKKAIGLTTFVCQQGQAIEEAVNYAVTSKQPTTISLISTGRNDAGEVIAEFTIEWSFKARG